MVEMAVKAWIMIPVSQALKSFPALNRFRPKFCSPCIFWARQKFSSAFTLIELVVVISIIGIAASIMVIRTGTYDFWQEESFLRRFSETMQFLFHQAVQDGEYYRLELNFRKNTYSVGVMRNEGAELEAVNADTDTGALNQELESFLNPSISQDATLIPPPSFPSLAEPQSLPNSLRFEDVYTMLQGQVNPSLSESASILFSPRGFSEFAVIHFATQEGGQITLLVNPFTGLVQIFRERREFKWSYGSENSNANK